MRVTQKHFVAVFALGVFLLSLGNSVQPTQVFAQTFNQQINYQGKLTASSSVAVPDGNYDMAFALYTAASGGSAIWSESRTGGDQVSVNNGLFSVMLGEVSTLVGVDFSQTLYLGVNIEADGEMTPRKILGAVPAAFEAGNATTFNNLATSSFLRSDQSDTMAATSASTLLTVTQNGAGDILNLFDGATEVFTVTDGGKVGIGTTTPSSKLAVQGDMSLATTSDNAFTVNDAVGENVLTVDTNNSNNTLSSAFITNKEIGITGSGRGISIGVVNTGVLSSFVDFAAGRNLEFTQNGSTKMIIGGRSEIDGFVGIGTTTPSSKLTVQGDMLLATTSDKAYTIKDTAGNDVLVVDTNEVNNDRTTVYINANQLGITTTSLRKSILGLKNSGDLESYIDYSNGRDLRFNEDGNTRMMISGATDNVGIGTTTPSQRLTVSGNLRLTGALFDSVNSAGTNGMVLQSTASGTQWVSTSSLAIGSPFGASINANELASEDFGSFTCNGTTCSLDTGSVATSQILDGTINFGDINFTNTLASNPTLGASQTYFGSTGILFEGSTADTFEGLLATADITGSDKTWTLPNTTGTIALTSSAMTGTFDGNNFGGGAIGTGDLLYGSAAGTIAERAIGTTGQILQVSGGLPVWAATSSLGIKESLFTDGGATTYLTALSDGLAIGTSSASKLLEVYGAAEAGGRFIDSTNGVTIDVRAEDFQGFLGTVSNSDLRFITNNTSRMTLDTAGNLGIGTTTPGSKLTVAGNINLTGSLLFNGTALSINNLSDGFNDGSNLGVGTGALANIVGGSDNTAVGVNALYSNTSGESNTALGAYALSFNTTGVNNTANGTAALLNNTTGANNVAIGTGALLNNTTGADNIAVGLQAGMYLNDEAAASTTDFSVFLGGDTRALGVNDQNTIVIGQGARGLGSNTVVLGSDSIVTTALKGNVGIGTTTPSSKLTVQGDVLFATTSDNAFVIRDAAGESVFVVDTNNTNNERSNAFASNEQMGITNQNYDRGIKLGIKNSGNLESYIDYANNRDLQFRENGVTKMMISGATGAAKGDVGIGTTTPLSRLSIAKTGFDGSGIVGISQYLQTTNSVASAVQFGSRFQMDADNSTTTTIVGSAYGIKDSTTFGNTVRGLEVQTNRGSNTQGENTAISGFARTFGVRGVTSGDAGGFFEPAGGFFETEGTTQGNALRGYSQNITSATLLSLFQDTSAFTGTGLEMNFGNTTGSFSSSTSKYLDFQNAGVSVFTVSAYGTTTIGDGTTNNIAGLQIGYGGICVDNDGSCVASTTGRITAVSYGTANSDLAENYFSSQRLETGEVVTMSGGLSVARAEKNNPLPILGVVSTKPGLTMGFDDTSLRTGETAYPIALTGRVPVKLSTENGPIKKGDQLMLSSLSGVAMKATGTGATIGIALEDFIESRMYSDTYLNQFGDDMVDGY